MSYKYSKGPTVQGDIAARPDVQRDTKINFEEDYIALEASGSAVLVVSGSKVGVGLTNPSHKFDVNGDIRVRGNDIRDNSGNPAISFDGSANTTVVNNLTVQDYTFPASDGSDGQVLQTNGSGQLSFVDDNEVGKFGSGTLTTGKLYYLNGSAWAEADADAPASGADQLLGIALGSSPTSDGLLLRGFFDASSYLSNFSGGKAVYVSTTAGGMDTTQPSGTGDFVRIVGYCTSTSNVIYFNPSSTWIEL
tara:strand:- start:2320 stop:3066 length:747 start_codon:yes stop_codon:yes gene_type:complete